jgi:hypothetical protein
MVLAAVTEVGLTMTVVGAVAGSNDLLKIGGVLSLVGSVGGMIAGAGTAAAGEAAAGALSDSATDAALSAASEEAVTASAADMALGETVGQAQLAELAGGQGIVSSPVNLSPMPQPAPIGPADATKAMGNMAQTVPVPQVQADPLSVQAPQGAQAPIGPKGVDAPVSPADANVNPTDMRLAEGTQQTPMQAPSDSSSFFGKFSTWANENKTLFNGGMQLAGGALSGAAKASAEEDKMDFYRDKFNRSNSVGTWQPRGIVGGVA